MRDRLALAGVALAPAAIAAAVVAALTGPWWGAAALVIVAGAVAVWIRLQDRVVLRAARARPLTPAENPRAHNLVAALAARLGMGRPEVHLLPTARPTALVCRPGAVAVVGLSAGLLRSCTRTELEAVIAAQLLRLEGADLLCARTAAALGPLAGPWALRDDLGADVRTAAVTRYPPGLAAVVTRLQPEGGRLRGFYFAAAGGADPRTRAHALRDL